jgi:hypothetical protein
MRESNALLYAALVAFVSGCHNWTPTEIPSTAGPLAGNPKQVQVTRTDGTSVTLTHPVVSADSLAGSTYVRGQGDVRLAIPKAEITNVKASTFNGAKTAGLVVVIAAASVGVLYLALMNSELGGPLYTPVMSRSVR